MKYAGRDAQAAPPVGNVALPKKLAAKEIPGGQSFDKEALR
jgi:hypothetical protein